MKELVARCHGGLDAMSLQGEFVDRLGRILPLEAVFCASVDPATLLFTSAVVEEIPRDSTPRFLANEFLEEDVNKFSTLAHRRFPVDWLDHATGADRAASARYRDIMAPLGLGDELRAAFRSGGECWGFLCVHREDGSRGFTEREARVVAGLAPHVGEGLRRALLVDTADVSAGADGPGVLVLAEDGSLIATTEAGERWLWELAGPDQHVWPLPVAVETVLARLEAIQRSPDPVNLLPRVRVRTRSGRWAVLHASEMAGLGQGRHVAVVVERATPAELAPLILLAYGLTKREAEVAQLALQGKTNKALAGELRISENTVEDHLKTIFAKVGVGSRGELTARVFSDHYIH
ncbi:MAG TPA: LuxR C-terminal-related transcriptional regulator [Acidimicrobiales bacterium]|nr:LuxR C-terminal-related transcriptional regulator [Acidimicrobiales bacterium]